MPEEALQHADAVVAGEGELVWPQVLSDFEQGTLAGIYRSCALPDVQQMPAPRWDLIKGRVYGKGVTIATRGCPFACEYCTIPAMYQRRMRYRPIPGLVDEIRRMPGKALILWDDNIGANKRYAKELFEALRPLKRWWTSQATYGIWDITSRCETSAASATIPRWRRGREYRWIGRRDPSERRHRLSARRYLSTTTAATTTLSGGTCPEAIAHPDAQGQEQPAASPEPPSRTAKLHREERPVRGQKTDPSFDDQQTPEHRDDNRGSGPHRMPRHNRRPGDQVQAAVGERPGRPARCMASNAAPHSLG